MARRKKQLPESTAIIELDNVTKVYEKGAPALNGVSISIERGEFVFIVGDSGSGKSTLIKLLLRELTATSGTVRVMGTDLSRIRHRKIPKFRRNLGIVFQERADIALDFFVLIAEHDLLRALRAGEQHQ